MKFNIEKMAFDRYERGQSDGDDGVRRLSCISQSTLGAWHVLKAPAPLRPSLSRHAHHFRYSPPFNLHSHRAEKGACRPNEYSGLVKTQQPAF